MPTSKIRVTTGWLKGEGEGYSNPLVQEYILLQEHLTQMLLMLNLSFPTTFSSHLANAHFLIHSFIHHSLMNKTIK
jgi:hypothetical protein